MALRHILRNVRHMLLLAAALFVIAGFRRMHLVHFDGMGGSMIVGEENNNFYRLDEESASTFKLGNYHQMVIRKVYKVGLFRFALPHLESSSSNLQSPDSLNPRPKRIRTTSSTSHAGIKDILKDQHIRETNPRTQKLVPRRKKKIAHVVDLSSILPIYCPDTDTEIEGKNESAGLEHVIEWALLLKYSFETNKQASTGGDDGDRSNDYTSTMYAVWPRSMAETTVCHKSIQSALQMTGYQFLTLSDEAEQPGETKKKTQLDLEPNGQLRLLNWALGLEEHDAVVHWPIWTLPVNFSSLSRSLLDPLFLADLPTMDQQSRNVENRQKLVANNASTHTDRTQENGKVVRDASTVDIWIPFSGKVSGENVFFIIRPLTNPRKQQQLTNEVLSNKAISSYLNKTRDTDKKQTGRRIPESVKRIEHKKADVMCLHGTNWVEQHENECSNVNLSEVRLVTVLDVCDSSELPWNCPKESETSTMNDVDKDTKQRSQMHVAMCRKARETWFDLKALADQKEERREKSAVSRWLRTLQEVSKEVKKGVRSTL